jgi:hypothetical protein
VRLFRKKTFIGHWSPLTSLDFARDNHSQSDSSFQINERTVIDKLFGDTMGSVVQRAERAALRLREGGLVVVFQKEGPEKHHKCKR